LTDVVRGVDKIIFTNSGNGESTFAGGISSFDSDGFSLAGNDTGFNASGDTYVSWNWLANNTSGSSNTAGTITSTVAANTTAGFSIATYTGNGVSGATVGHGLGVAPKLQMIKKRNGTTDWAVVGSFSPFGTQKRIAINGTTAMGTPADIYPTLPTSTVFSPGDSGDTNGNGSTYIAYSFAEIKGYSKIGSYTGNGNADGTFVYTGFKPAFVLVKNTTTAGTNWQIVDNKRVGYNGANHRLYPDDSAAESTTQTLDILSNGFKAITTNNLVNASSATYIYMAFAENPFVSSTSIPTTAR
jgi:hypothetical protein